MKIAYLFDDTLDRPDGVQQYMTTLGEWMRQQGHQVKYLVSESRQPIVDKKHVISLSSSIKVSGNSNTMTLPSVASKKLIKQVLKKEGFDIVHVQMPYSPTLSGRVISSLENERLFGTFHIVGKGKLINFGAFLLGLSQRHQYRHFDQVYSVSKAALYYSKSYFNLNSRIMPNVFPMQKYITKPGDINGVKILFLGRLVERKGCIYLINAVKLLLQENPGMNIKLTIAGKGKLKDELENYVRQNNLENHIEFIGFVNEEDKAELFNSHSFCVFPSTGGESFGIILLEAMAAMRSGIVLAGDNAGYRTVMPKEFLFKTASPEAIKDKLHEYMNYRELDAFIQKQDQIAARYDVERIGPKILADYKTCLEGTR